MSLHILHQKLISFKLLSKESHFHSSWNSKMEFYFISSSIKFLVTTFLNFQNKSSWILAHIPKNNRMLYPQTNKFFNKFHMICFNSSGEYSLLNITFHTQNWKNHKTVWIASNKQCRLVKMGEQNNFYFLNKSKTTKVSYHSLYFNSLYQ